MSLSILGPILHIDMGPIVHITQNLFTFIETSVVAVCHLGQQDWFFVDTWLGLRLRLIGDVTIYFRSHSTHVDMGPILHITQNLFSFICIGLYAILKLGLTRLVEYVWKCQRMIIPENSFNITCLFLQLRKIKFYSATFCKQKEKLREVEPCKHFFKLTFL